MAALFVTPFLLTANAQKCESGSSLPPNAPQQVKISVTSVEFPTSDTLSDELHTQLIATVKKEFEVATEALDTDWLSDFIEDEVRNVLMNAGYFKAQTSTTPYLIRAEAHQRFYAVRIEGEAGPLYHLAEIQFTSATVFDHADLRKQFRLKTGEPFDLSRIREGIESVHGLYSTKGYIDARIEPRINVNDEKQEINLAMLVNEEVQYRVGTIEINGLDDETTNRLMDRLLPGRVFDISVLKGFLEEDERNVNFHRHTHDQTVDIFLDVRKKACVESATRVDPI